MIVSVGPSHRFPIQITVLYLYVYIYASAYNDCKLNVDVEPPLNS